MDGDTAEVTRSVDVEAAIDEVWHAVVDPAARAGWLDDPDALARRVRVDERRPGHRLVWTWWHPGDEAGASTVTVVLTPATGGGTRVVVTESRPAAPPGPTPGAGARACSDRWDRRLLGLELRFLAVRAGVG
jgi:uncharacterized protein YndB with AHSA1/START domain